MQLGKEPRKQAADLVIQGGKVATVDTAFSIQESVAVRDGKIIFTGKRRNLQQYIGSGTKILEIDGGLVLPGLVDAHAHMNSYSQELAYLNVTNTTSFEELVQRIADRVRDIKPEEWILGGRWDQNKWSDLSFPTHDALSAVSPENPVYLKRVDGNAALVNAKALEIAGIDEYFPDPWGGVIHRKPNGEPTGVLLNRAMDVVEALIPRDTVEQYKAKLLAAIDCAASYGLTGWHEAGVVPWEIAVYNELNHRGALKLRCYGMLGDERNPEYEGDLVTYFRENRQEDDALHMFSVRSVKLFFDGALGSRGAAFFEPYTDDPDNIGLIRITPEYIERVARAALQTDMQVSTHAIGIRGNRLCLEAYEKALLENPVKDHRFRIEHAQFVEPRDVSKFVELGVIPSMQPTHCTSDMSFVEQRIGFKRAKTGYVWRDFLDRGMIIPCGSDFPVESPNPLLGIYAAVTRSDPAEKPEEGWFPDQRMNIEEAIRGFTIWAAIAAFREKALGSIEVGKLADFTILDRDILELPARNILKARVLYTIVGGRIIYSAKCA